MVSKFFNTAKFSSICGLMWGIVFFIYFRHITGHATEQFIYLVLFSFGSAAVLGSALFFISFILLLLPKVLYTLTSIVTVYLITTFMIVDLQIFSMYRLHMDSISLYFIKNSLSVPQIAVIFSILPIIITIWILARKIKNKKIFISFACILLTAFVICAALPEFKEKRTFYSYLTPVAKLIEVDANPEELIKKRNKFSLLMNYPSKQLTSLPRKMNIILIVIDAWRFDTVNVEIMPNIKSFSAKSSVFTRHSAGGNGYYDSFFQLLYGLPYYYKDIVTADNTPSVLIDELNRSNYNINMFDDNDMFKLNGNFINFLNSEGLNKPFFSIIHYKPNYNFDNKVFTPKFVPYDKFSSNKDHYLNQYKNSLGYTDQMIGRLLFGLETHGYMNNTIVIITGNYGEEFNETSSMGHGSNYSIYQTQVPLIVYIPEVKHATYNHRTDHTDILPVIMQQVFGVQDEMRNYTTGKNLFDSSERVTYLSKNAVKNGDITAVFKLGTVVFLDEYGKTLKNGTTNKVFFENLYRFNRHN